VISIVCWKWKSYTDLPHYRFTAEHVNTLANMVRHSYRGRHEVVCITDDAEGVDKDIRVVPIWDTYADVPNPMGDGYPRCYRRLYAFSEGFKKIVPNRYVSLDLDCVIVDDVTPLWDRYDDVVFWSHARQTPTYNGSMWLHKPGTRPEIWDRFNPEMSPKAARAAGFRGSDQAWLNYIVPGERTWGRKQGVYNWDTHISNRGGWLPKNARIVFFCGQTKPWDKLARERAPWVSEYYK
jgi:hypothetical protein